MQRPETEREPCTSQDLLVVCMAVQLYTVEYHLKISNVCHHQNKFEGRVKNTTLLLFTHLFLLLTNGYFSLLVSVKNCRWPQL